MINADDLARINREYEVILKEFTDSNINLNQARDLLNSLKKSADGLGVPLTIDEENLNRIQRNIDNGVDVVDDDYDDYYEESSSSDYEDYDE